MKARRKLAITFIAALLAPAAQAAGTVSQTLAQLSAVATVGNARPVIHVLTVSWTADSAAATIPSTVLLRSSATLGDTDGLFLLGVETIPGSPAPTALYDIAITNAAGRDVMGGSCADRSASVAEICAPAAGNPPLKGNLTLVITNNSVNSAKGQVVLYLATGSTSASTGGGIFAVAGSTNNTAMSYAAQGKNGGCDPTGDFQSGQGGAGVNWAAIGVAGCVKVAASSTNQGAAGVEGSATNSSTTTNAVAGYFPAFAGAAGSGSADASRVRIWGVNPLVADNAFANVMLNNELDFNVTAANTKVLGLQLTGASTQDVSADSAGVLVGPLGSGHKWPVGFICSDSAVTKCLSVGTSSASDNVSSQTIGFISRNSGGAASESSITAPPNAGFHFATTAGAGTVDFSPNGAVTWSGLALANLAPTTNGTVIYCTDCANASNPCTGSSTGAIAKRLNGAWDCR